MDLVHFYRHPTTFQEMVVVIDEDWEEEAGYLVSLSAHFAFYRNTITKETMITPRTSYHETLSTP